MSWVITAVVGTGLVGAYLGSQASRDAAETQAGAADRASDVQRHVFDQQREDATPWRAAGERALGGLEDGDFKRDFTMADYKEDPGYQFRLSEGQKAIDRSGAARGGLNSGATLKSLARFSQGLASEEYQNSYNRFNADRDRRFNRLSSLAGIGQTANSQVASAGQNYGNQVGQNIVGAGNAIAAGQVGQANAWGNALSTGANSYMNYQLMSQLAKK